MFRESGPESILALILRTRWYPDSAVDPLRESRLFRRRRSNRPGNLSGTRTAEVRRLWRAGLQGLTEGENRRVHPGGESLRYLDRTGQSAVFRTPRSPR